MKPASRFLAVVLCLAAACSAWSAVTFQPEVLLMRTSENARDKSFKYATLKPVEVDDKTGFGTFNYRASAEGIVVDVTITVKKKAANGTLTVNVRVVRTKLNEAGGDQIARNKDFTFRPGTSLIVDNDWRLKDRGPDGVAEILQLTLVK